MTLTSAPRLRAALLATVLLAVLGTLLGGLVTTPTSATFRDSTGAKLSVQSSRFATYVCVIWSNEARADVVFSLTSRAQLGNQGWSEFVDKRSATTVGELAGCDVVMIAGEAWGVTAPSRQLALDWFNHNGSVLSTGNDTGHPTYPLPELIGATGGTVANYPYGGSVPASAATLAAVVPAFPAWTPGALGTFDYDATSAPVTLVAEGARCVGTVAGHPEWCAVIARTNGTGGRWVHMHTKIGSGAPGQQGDVPGADAALAWLAIGRS